MGPPPLLPLVVLVLLCCRGSELREVLSAGCRVPLLASSAWTPPALAPLNQQPAEGDRLDVLREVDEVFINAIREWGLYDKIWQAFAVFLPVRSVGERRAGTLLCLPPLGWGRLGGGISWLALCCRLPARALCG